MKKKLFRMWLIFFVVTWVLYVGFQFFLWNVRGHEFILLDKCVIAVVFSFFVSSGPLVAAYYSVIPRSKYLESNDIAKPSFRVPYSSVVNMPQGFDFTCLKTKIADKWVVTFSDDMEKILKFRTKFHIFSNWGTAAWMKYDAETEKFYLDFFPMVIGTRNDLVRKMQKEVEKCLSPNELA